MLLAQINRDSQGMAEFHDADGQPVTLCLAEAVTVGGEPLKLYIVTKNLLTSLQNCTSNHIWISVPVLVEDGKIVSRSNRVLAGTKGITSQSCCFILWRSTPLLLKLKVYVLLLSYFPDADQMESMDTVSLQAVTLADGSTAYIQHDTKGSFSDGQIMDGQVIQLEDGSAAYVQHVPMPKAGK